MAAPAGPTATASRPTGALTGPFGRVRRIWRRVSRAVGDVLPKGLYARSLIIIIAPMVLLQSVIAYTFMERHWQLVTRRLSAAVTRLAMRLREGIVPPDPSDSRNCILELRGAAGGAESALFAADLLRMYQRYAETQGWKFEVLDASSSDLGGYKDATVSVTGQDVYKRLRYESGVHRVQRVPATEAQGRIHTSTVTVAVMPEAQEVDVVIKPEDLEINVCRAGGHGGQGVNTTDSAVRIFHKPTGTEVRCQDERSQIKNKAKAMMVLRSRLLDAKVAEEHAKYAAERKSQVGTGERSEKSRTYNFPQNRVSDHRIDLTLYNLSAVIDGDLDPVIDPLMAGATQRKLDELKL